MLKAIFQQELKESMLARNELKTSVLRMLISAITYYEIQKGGTGYNANEEDVLKVIEKEAKQRKDSISQFMNANRQDLVDKEKKELDILQKYLPDQMPEEEIIKYVKEAILQTEANSMQDIGKIMSVLMPKLKGKADGSIVTQIIKKELT
ncbi:MAG: GatB/YqeY domain-containing protein [Candidatus Levybacteria bacterium]|nr:GatB/YqeY domain-containing protein [Candidatus Levybacteria bacterium]